MSAKRGCAGAPGTCSAGATTRTGGGKNQETCLQPEAERYCWSSAQKRWVNVTEAGIKVNLQKPGFANQVCGAAAGHMDAYMHYWGGNIFTIPVSFMVTLCGKGRRNIGCETTSLHSGHFCWCFVQNVFFVFTVISILT